MNIRKIFLTVFALVLFGGAALAQDPVPLYPDNYKVLLENGQVRVLDFQLKKGAKGLCTKSYFRIDCRGCAAGCEAGLCPAVRDLN